MSVYAILIFVHVAGAIGMFAVWAIDATVLAQLLRSTTLEQARAVLALRRRVVPMAALSMVATGLSGALLMRRSWGPTPWLLTAIAAMVAIGITGIVSERRSRAALRAALAAPGERMPAGARAAAARLAASLQLRVVIGVAILALMTIKPTLPGSLSIAAIAAGVGLAAAYRASRGVSAARRPMSADAA